MKSTVALAGLALLFLVLALAASGTLWSTVSFPVKLGMFAFGFGSGVSVGVWLVRRSK